MTNNNDKSFLDSITGSSKPESFQGETFVPVKKSPVKWIILISALILIPLVVLAAINNSRKIIIMDFVGKSLNEASVWAQRNDISIIAEYAYDFDSAEGIILSQDPANPEYVLKKSSVYLIVSQGPDPEENIVFPDVDSMTADEIEEWADENKLTGVRLNEVYSSIIPLNMVIDYSFTDGDQTNFKRKNRVTINVSLGPEIQGDTVITPDFTAMTPGKILQWSWTNNVDVELTEEYSDYFNSGTVMKQSIASGTEILRSSKVSVTISKGPPVEVPSFYSMSKEDVTAWAKSAGINVSITEIYSSTVVKSSLISQSVNAGEFVQTGDTIKFQYSLGKIEIPDFTGKTRLEVLTWQREANLKGAAVIVNISEDYGEKGTFDKVVGQNIKNILSDPEIMLEITISKGAQVVVPDFSGLYEDEIAALAKDNLINLSLRYISDETFPLGLFISQSHEAGTIITDNVEVQVFTAASANNSNLVVLPDFQTMNMAKILTWSEENNITTLIKEEFNEHFSQGSVIRQNYLRGQSVSLDTIIEITVSQGPPITVPDFSDMLKEEISSWAKSNNINIINTDMYSTFFNKGALLSQSITSDSIVKAGTDIVLCYSLGNISVPSFLGKTRSDVLIWQDEINLKEGNLKTVFYERPGEKGSSGKILEQSTIYETVVPGTEIVFYISTGSKIIVPDFAKMELTQIESYAKANSLNIIYEYTKSDTVPKNYFVSQSPSPSDIIKDNEPILVVLSSSVTDSNMVIVPDFYDMRAAAILKWADDNEVKVNLYEEYHQFISSGSVISQSVPAGTGIAKSESFNIVLSRGKAPDIKSSFVPDFSMLSETQAVDWAKEASVTLLKNYSYSDTQAAGKIFYQDRSAGSIITQSESINITISSGRISIPDFTGNTQSQVQAWILDVNSKGGSISAVFTQIPGISGSYGKVMSQSVINNYIKLTDTISFEISEGLKVPVPDFTTKTRPVIQTEAQSLGIQVIFDYGYSDTIAEGIMISQSIAAGTIISERQSITITISAGTNP